MIWPFKQLIERRNKRKVVTIYLALLLAHDDFAKDCSSKFSASEDFQAVLKYDLLYSISAMYCLLSSISPCLAKMFFNYTCIDRYAVNDGFTANKFEDIVGRFDSALHFGQIRSVGDGLMFLSDELFVHDFHFSFELADRFVKHPESVAYSIFSLFFSFDLKSPLIKPRFASASSEDFLFFVKFYPAFIGCVFVLFLLFYSILMPANDKTVICNNAYLHSPVWIVMIFSLGFSCLVSGYYVVAGLFLSLSSHSETDGQHGRSVLSCSLISLTVSFVLCCPLSHFAFYYDNKSETSFENKRLSVDRPISDIDRLRAISIKHLSN